MSPNHIVRRRRNPARCLKLCRALFSFSSADQRRHRPVSTTFKLLDLATELITVHKNSSQCRAMLHKAADQSQKPAGADHERYPTPKCVAVFPRP